MSHSLNPPHAPQAGAIQGIIIALTAFLPILAIVSLAPAVPTLIQHFAGVPYVETLVPLMLTAPGLVIAIAGPCTGWLADKFGRRKLLLSATLLYGICGTMPLYITSLTGIFCSRLGVGLAEAVVLTIANTMLIDYFDDKQRRFWLTVQGVIGPALAVLVLLAEEHSAAAYKMGLRPDTTVYTLLTWAVLWSLFSRLPEIPKPLQFIARHSFGLYLAHPLVLRLWNAWAVRQTPVIYLHLWQMFALALAGGLAIAVTLSYLPFGEYLGGAKRTKKILQRRA